MKSIKMTKLSYWSSLIKWAKEEEAPSWKDGTWNWLTKQFLKWKRPLRSSAKPLKKPSSQRTKDWARQTVYSLSMDQFNSDFDQYTTTFRLAQAHSGVDIDSILVDTLQWGVTNQLAIVMTTAALPEGQCYNSFPLLIYSLDCSFSLSTYLER